jgi:hypothetical protein
MHLFLEILCIFYIHSKLVRASTSQRNKNGTTVLINSNDNFFVTIVMIIDHTNICSRSLRN